MERFEKTLKDIKYEGIVKIDYEKDSLVYVPHEVDNDAYVLYKVNIPVVELGLNHHNVRTILDMAIETCEEMGTPISGPHSFDIIKMLTISYANARETLKIKKKYMDFDFELLKSGTLLKRKDWKGFWKWDEVRKSIMMHCEDGQAIDIRKSKDMGYTLSNMFESDWEEVNEENSEVYRNMQSQPVSEHHVVYKVIGYEHDAFDKFKCPVCGGDIFMSYDMYNGVEYDKDCRCVISIEDRHQVDVEIRQYMDQCQIDV